MKKFKYYLLALILSFLCLDNVYAACTEEEINEFKKVEDEYKVTYEFDKKTKKYTLNFNEAIPDKYVYAIYGIGNAKCTGIDDKSFKLENVNPGSYELKINGNTSSCKGALKTYILNLPKYNKYSEDKLCEEIEEFVLCQPTYDKDIDYETFKSRIETYKKTKDKEEPEKELNEQTQYEIPNFIKNISDYIKDNLIYITIIAIFIILLVTTIIITVKQQRKSRRLE